MIPCNGFVEEDLLTNIQIRHLRLRAGGVLNVGMRDLNIDMVERKQPAVCSLMQSHDPEPDPSFARIDKTRSVKVTNSSFRSA